MNLHRKLHPTQSYEDLKTESSEVRVNHLLDMSDIVSGYENVSQDFEMWDMYGLDLSQDYLVFKSYIIEQLDFVTFDLASNKGKELAIRLDAKETALDYDTADGKKIAYLMGGGMSLEESKNHLRIMFADHNAKDSEVCRGRVMDKYTLELIGKYLSPMDMSDFYYIVQPHLSGFKDYAIRGLGYDRASTTENIGVCNFLMSTPTTMYENNGLIDMNYEMLNGDPDAENLRLELFNWWINGTKI